MVRIFLKNPDVALKETVRADAEQRRSIEACSRTIRDAQSCVSIGAALPAAHRKRQRRVFITAWGNAPGIVRPMYRGLKARPISTAHGSGLQPLVLICVPDLGRCPRLL